MSNRAVEDSSKQSDHPNPIVTEQEHGEDRIAFLRRKLEAEQNHLAGLQQREDDLRCQGDWYSALLFRMDAIRPAMEAVRRVEYELDKTLFNISCCGKILDVFSARAAEIVLEIQDWDRMIVETSYTSLLAQLQVYRLASVQQLKDIRDKLAHESGKMVAEANGTEDGIQ